MNRVSGIDILKLLCAVMVIFLHVSTPYRPYVLPITRSAVPCFFIISGYFIYNAELEIMEHRICRGIKKVSFIMLWSTLLFAALKCLLAYRSGSYGFFSWGALRDFIVFNQNPFGFHLWYLGAYIYTLFIVLVFGRLGNLKVLVILTPFLLLSDLVFGKYSLLFFHREFPYIWLRNFMFVGIPYFTIGMGLKMCEAEKWEVTKIRKWLLLLICLFSFMSIIENRVLVYYGLNATRDHYLSSTFLSLFLFIFFLRDMDVNHILTEWGRKKSLYIYVYHPLFIILLSRIIPKLPRIYHVVYSYMAPVIVLGLTVLLIKLIDYMFSRRKHITVSNPISG